MSCSITSGITLSCKDSQGGIDYIYVGDLPDYDTITTDVDGLVTGLELSGAPVTVNLYKFEVPKQSSSFTETINADNTAQTVFYQQDALMVFTKNGGRKERSNQTACTKSKTFSCCQRRQW